MERTQGGSRPETVSPTGDIDLATAGQVENMIVEALRSQGGAGVVVDLSRVEFLDSAGVRTLLRGRKLANELGALFSVTGANGIVKQVLEMTGVWDYLSGPIDG